MRRRQIHHAFDLKRPALFTAICLLCLVWDPAPGRGRETVSTRSVFHALTSAYILDIYHNWPVQGQTWNKASLWLRLRAKRVDGTVVAAAYKDWNSEGRVTIVARGKYNRTLPAIMDIVIERQRDAIGMPDPGGIPYITFRAYEDMKPGTPDLVRGDTELLWGTKAVTAIRAESWRVE